MEKEKLIEEIINLEWEQFTTTVNIGHRAYCQDRKSVFLFSRKAYFDIYEEDILSSYLKDMRDIVKQGHNIVTLKYAYMMEYTDKDSYDKIKEQLLPLSEEKRSLVSAIMEVYVFWLERLDKELSAGGSRPLFSVSDGKRTTSVETYMRGELLTYSPATLKKILVYFLVSAAEGKNLARCNVENLN